MTAGVLWACAAGVITRSRCAAMMHLHQQSVESRAAVNLLSRGTRHGLPLRGRKRNQQPASKAHGVHAATT
jgi:hypothetical protein